MRCLILVLCGCVVMVSGTVARAELRVGAAVVDVSPTQFPVLVNGGMTSREAKETVAPLNARAIVLADGKETLAIVVVDSCMIPRPVLDDAKHQAARKTGIRTDRMLISATHTHTAPSSMGCLGTNADEAYIPFLRERIAQAIVEAQQNLQAANVGWGKIDAGEFTAVRRWIFRSDRVQTDPFGNPTVRANMHAGGNWDNVTGPSGPEDPDLSLISFQTPDGKPIAVLANFSMHYFSGVAALHPDYFGLFSDGLAAQLSELHSATGVVAMMSHGCSGDIWRRDYMVPPEERNENLTINQFSDGMIKKALECYQGITHQSVSDLAMEEARIELKYRTPNVQLLEWSKRIAAEVGDRLPKTTAEIYALEQIILHERQSTEVVLQAIRIGEIAIATTPNETYALTGLKLKLQSPLEKTMVIELANGGDGYIPPPEQHVLGGYNTWAARSAGLEVQAEPKIVETLLELLGNVCGQSLRAFQQPEGELYQASLRLKPVVYYRLDEFAGDRIHDRAGAAEDGQLEPGVAFFLDGPESEAFTGHEVNRSVHFTGGRIKTRVAKLGDLYTISLWLWNGMPLEGRVMCGYLFGRGTAQPLLAGWEQLGIQGSGVGKLVFETGADDTLLGKTEIPRWTWQHVVIVRDGDQVKVYLNDLTTPEMEGTAALPKGGGYEQLFFAGAKHGHFNFEGRLDEIAVFDRVLTDEERLQLSPARPEKVSAVEGR